MKVRVLTTMGALAMAAATCFSPATAEARHIDEIRGQVAVVRGHSRALRDFLRAKCRVVPNLHSAETLAERLACRAEELWDVVRHGDCRLSAAEIDRQLCAMQTAYQMTDQAVRAAAAYAPRHHLRHACHLLERIDHHLCKARSVASAWAQASQPPVVVRRHHLGSHYDPHARPHVDPHVQPHVDPHRRSFSNPYDRSFSNPYSRSFGSPYGNSTFRGQLGRNGSFGVTPQRHGQRGQVQFRIGGLTFRF